MCGDENKWFSILGYAPANNIWVLFSVVRNLLLYYKYRTFFHPEKKRMKFLLES